MVQFKLYWRLFIIIVLLGAVSLACGFGSNSVSQNPQVKLSPEHKLCYQALQSTTQGIYAIKPDGSGEVPLIEGSFFLDFAAFEPAWSPDGSRVAFTSRPEDHDEIFVANLDGSGYVNITNHPAWDSNPAWSPDGSQIVFVSDRGDGNELFIMNADGANVRQLTDTREYSSHPAWSPDGRQIAFSREGSQDDPTRQIFVINVDGSSLTQLTHNQTGTSEPTWSPEGTQIAFSVVNDETLRRDIYVMNADGSNMINLTNSAMEDDESPVWSPDGSRIAFISDRRDDNFDIYVINPDGSNVAAITKSHWAEKSVDWRP